MTSPQFQWRFNNSPTPSTSSNLSECSRSTTNATSPPSYTYSQQNSSNEHLPKLQSLNLNAPIAPPLPTPNSNSSNFNNRGTKRTRSSSSTSISSQGSFNSPNLNDSCVDRKCFADGLIETAVFTVEAIWKCPLPQDPKPQQTIEECQLPLKYFIRETLRRSKTSCSTLQTALFYLFKIRDKVKNRRVMASEMLCGGQVKNCDDSLLCGRRTFLSALILASKFLQERQYSNRAWAKMSGLSSCEISNNERAFLILIDYELNISECTWKRWAAFLITLVEKHAIRSTSPTPQPSPCQQSDNKEDEYEKRCNKRTCTQYNKTTSTTPITTPSTTTPKYEKINDNVTLNCHKSYSTLVSWEGVKATSSTTTTATTTTTTNSNNSSIRA